MGKTKAKFDWWRVSQDVWTQYSPVIEFPAGSGYEMKRAIVCEPYVFMEFNRPVYCAWFRPEVQPYLHTYRNTARALARYKALANTQQPTVYCITCGQELLT